MGWWAVANGSSSKQMSRRVENPPCDVEGWTDGRSKNIGNYKLDVVDPWSWDPKESDAGCHDPPRVVAQQYDVIWIFVMIHWWRMSNGCTSQFLDFVFIQKMKWKKKVQRFWRDSISRFYLHHIFMLYWVNMQQIVVFCEQSSVCIRA